MKRLAYLLLALLTAGALTSCDNERQEIKKVAKGYLEAVGNYRFEEAEPYVTQGTKDTTLAFFKAILPMTDSDYLASNTPAEITINSINMTSDETASVAFSKKTPLNEVKDTVLLRKCDGQWLVDNVISVPPVFRMLLNPPSPEERERMKAKMKERKARRDSIKASME